MTIIDFIQPLFVENSTENFNALVKYVGIEESYGPIKTLNHFYVYLDLKSTPLSKAIDPEEVSIAIEDNSHISDYYLISYHNGSLEFLNRKKLCNLYKDWYHEDYKDNEDFARLFVLDNATAPNSLDGKHDDGTKSAFYVTGPYSDPETWNGYFMPTVYEQSYLTYHEAKENALTDTIDIQSGQAIYEVALVGHYEISKPEFFQD